MSCSSLILGRTALARQYRAYAISHSIKEEVCRQVSLPSKHLTRNTAIAVRLLCSAREIVDYDLILILHTSLKRLRFIFQSPLTLMLLLHFPPGPRVYALPALPKILNHFSQCWANTSVASS